MPASFSVKAGDTKEPLMLQLLNGGEPENLYDCRVRFYCTNGIKGDAEIRDEENGIVWYVFSENEVSDVGIYKAEFEVIYPDFHTQTFQQI
ncbi:BppU family phage baseplate upper protein [Lentibacillus amyloliquefaciens]|uniref:BppU N-terminal domain-containing protein n=1 Tax=Lentibacillus amyloliquefaciens TaxID=1472767 RepID=A0A0U4DYK3_9BACI|nr:BppU family phage baseplate upper protein [Lentibacillus amyloliquefaciens]ALX50472.1 hypothetical protein AOX59_18925 [Lentibacillus amyloliquefaciens]